jgi:hypothetical protein
VNTRQRIALTTATLVAATALAAAPWHTQRAESAAPSLGSPLGGIVVDYNPPQMEVPIDIAFTDQRSSGRAIMLRVEHTPDPQEPRRISVEKTRVYVRHGDTGPIKVTTFDRDGAVIETWRAADPLLVSVEAGGNPEARYGISYSDSLFGVEILDERTGASVFVKLDKTIRQFCESEPTDQICRAIDLQGDARIDDYTPRTLAVGESVDIPVHVSVRNAGTDWARVTGSMFFFGILDGLTIRTTDPTSFDVGVLDRTVQKFYDVNYTFGCEAAGDYRVFVGAGWGDGSPEAVDANPTDDRWNTYFDVTCTAP